MQLRYFLVKNFRSVEAQKKIPLSRQSVIIGPNNEGKSNILRSLHLGMKAIEAAAYPRFHRSSRDGRVSRTFAPRELALDRAMRRLNREYIWERDFPKKRQGKTYKQAKKTEITLEFLLSIREQEEFKKLTKVNLSANLPIKIEIGKDGLEAISVVMPGPAKKTLDPQISKICDFISNRISFEYFPSIRTAAAAERIVNEMVNARLREIDDEQLFEEFLDKVKKQYDPLLEDISREIEGTLKDFAPNVEAAKVSMDLNKGLDALRSSVQVLVNDGVETPIQTKGDGVQSLVSLALMKYSSRASVGKKQVILALEEPEAHLHPEAIHQISEIIDRLASEGQVVITTHCPLLVDRMNVPSNIIVSGSNVREAHNIAEIREILGVRVGDDLRSAQIIVFVEGLSDKIIVENYLAQNDNVRKALRSGVITVENLRGASTLSYKAQMYKNFLCEPCCILDNDSDGRSSIEKARAHGVISDDAMFILSRPGMNNSEIEDFIAEDVWRKVLSEKYGVAETSMNKKHGGKWSERVAYYFSDAGRPFDKQVLEDIKRLVVCEATREGSARLNPKALQPFESLRAFLASKVSKVETGGDGQIRPRRAGTAAASVS